MRPIEKVSAEIAVLEDCEKRLIEVYHTQREANNEGAEAVWHRVAHIQKDLDRLYTKKEILRELEYHAERYCEILAIIDTGLLKEALLEKMKEHGLI